MKNLKYNLFYIGILIFSITLFLEHLFLGENNITCFLKGGASALQIVGFFVLVKYNSRRKEL